MSQKIKDVLGIALIAALFGFTGVAYRYVGAYANSIEPSSYRSFSVSGEGRVVVVPDIAAIQFTVVTEGGKDIAALQAENTEKVNGAIAFVKGEGIADKDVKTESYQVNPRYQTFNCNARPYPVGVDYAVEPCPPSEIVGYSIMQTVSVKVRDFAKIGEILSGVVSAGANQVYGPNFTVDDPSALQNDAKIKAIENARAKAETIARASGFRIGRLLNIDEGVYGGPYYDKAVMGRGGAMEASAVAMPAPSIEPGSQDIYSYVNLRYEIQ